MVRTPEQYFQDQDFALPDTIQSMDLTSAEQAFLFKYVGTEGAKALGFELDDAYTMQQGVENIIRGEPALEEGLKSLPQLQMVFFQVLGQTYTMPIEAVHEVVKFSPPMQLPLMPHFMAGIINLRGRVTPLIHLQNLLSNVRATVDNAHKFIIVSQRKGIQFGMVIDKIENMFIISQKDITWNIELELGSSVECICGIIEHEKKIFGIISADKIVNHVLQSRGKL